MPVNRIMLIPMALLVLVRCADRPPTDSGAALVAMPDTTGARNLLATYCAACHGAEGSHAVAPSFREMHTAYAKAHSDLRSYVDAMAAFIAQPDPARAIMPDAVTTYGPMPNMGYRPEDARKMAAYLYQREGMVGTATGEDELAEHPIERSRSYAMGTKAVLGSNLLAAIKKYGTAGAVNFCNTRALPLTDSMATHYGVHIRRVSDKPRNDLNRASAEEAAYIAALKDARRRGETLEPGIAYRDGLAIGYYAIETNAMCLQCHGTPGKQVAEATQAAIQKKYPADEATGYSENEIRGIWVVEMPYRP